MADRTPLEIWESLPATHRHALECCARGWPRSITVAPEDLLDLVIAGLLADERGRFTDLGRAVAAAGTGEVTV